MTSEGQTGHSQGIRWTKRTNGADKLDKPQTQAAAERGRQNQRRQEGWSPVSQDGQPDKAPVANHALAARMREKVSAKAGSQRPPVSISRRWGVG